MLKGNEVAGFAKKFSLCELPKLDLIWTLSGPRYNRPSVQVSIICVDEKPFSAHILLASTKHVVKRLPLEEFLGSMKWRNVIV